MIFVLLKPSYFHQFLANLSPRKWKYRSSCPQVFLSKDILKICSKFTGEHPCRSWFSNFIDVTFGHGCSPVNLLHIFRAPFYNNNSGGLLLEEGKLIPQFSQNENKTLNIEKTYILIKTSLKRKFWTSFPNVGNKETFQLVEFKELFITITTLNNHAPKQSFSFSEQIMQKELTKVIILRSELHNKYLTIKSEEARVPHKKQRSVCFLIHWKGLKKSITRI